MITGFIQCYFPRCEELVILPAGGMASFNYFKIVQHSARKQYARRACSWLKQRQYGMPSLPMLLLLQPGE